MKARLALAALVGAVGGSVYLARAQFGGSSGAASTVSLSESSLSALAAPTCTFAAAPASVVLTTTPQDVPASPLTDRTQWRGVNEDSTRNIWCCVGTGCTPTSSNRWVIPSGFGDLVFEGCRADQTVRCRAASNTATINVQESSCGQ